MRVKVEIARILNSASEVEISSYAEQSVCAQTENQTQDLPMYETIKEETEIIKNDRMTKTDNTNDDNMYLLIMKSEESRDETLQIDEYKNGQCNETHVSMGDNGTCKENEVDDAAAKVIPKTNKTASNRSSRRSSRLSASDKKENLKKVCNPGKIVKQKTTRKSNRTTRSTKSDDILMMLYKKFETEEYYKSLLPSLAHVNHNNDNIVFDKSIPHYEVANQEELHQYGLDSKRNALQYLNYNHLNYQFNFMNSNPWSIASRSGQNMTLSNITNTQNNVGQSGIVNNDRQYLYAAVDYNWKQNENPYSYSSVNSTDPYKLLPTENKDYCLCNVCTSYMRSNMYPGIESFSRTSAMFQPMVTNNIVSSGISSTVTSNNLFNTGVGSFNPLCNYQQLQTDYGFKKLFHKTLNMVNYANNSGCEMTSIARENVMSPLNNWHHINHFTCNSNLNVPLNTAIMSNVSLSPVHAGNANAYFSNYYNRDVAEANVSADQYSEKENFHPYAVPTFENSLPTADTHELDSEKLTNTLSQNSTVTTSTDNDITTNFLSETDMAEVSEESPSDVDARKKDWFSDVFNTIYKDGF